MSDTTCLHVPSIDLIAAGDAVYNDDFLQLRESSPQTRQEWITALDTIDARDGRERSSRATSARAAMMAHAT